MARRLGKIRRLLAATVVILCLLVALVLIGVHTPPLRRYVADQVISLLKHQQIDLNTDQLGYNLFNASIDLRNVFNRLSDFSITDLRESGGIGLRVRTPWFLIRGDYGVVLDHRPGEPRSRFYFSIGQAF